MWCETVNNFLANHGILMEMFLKDMVLACAMLTFLGGMLLGWVVTEIRDRNSVTWKAPLWHDGEKWRVIEPSKEYYPVETHPIEGVKDSELHPVRFTHKQFRLIDHIMGEFSEYFEEEAEEFFATMNEYRDK